ncbi:EcsC family protein [Ferrimonas balearica]|uniref:EcsC family protein n=1 Tax=Ferrimonas balearica TaxID=44012 RepID=UPI001C99DC42|nr:EcsC family protein [Ferrimonas balearica]MBY5920237.1 EcsC family protein [Ferrimonas balearica]MBY5997078.1 EcsC family protein [Ferrimonas balearica]
MNGELIPLTEADRQRLVEARQWLESPGLAARISDKLGSPIEAGMKRLPSGWREKVNNLTQTALNQALKAAIRTMKTGESAQPSTRMHKFAVATSGGVGGFFGLPALALELPVSTTLILRAIADIARSEGEDLHDTDTQLACLTVFALGGKGDADDGAESGYFAVRAALAQSVTQAAEHLASRGMTSEGAPVLIRLITSVAQRFSVQVSQKVAAQAIPAIGAAGGATINTLFMDHYQRMARGHFTIRALERQYGQEAVQAAYLALGR